MTTAEPYNWHEDLEVPQPASPFQKLMDLLFKKRTDPEVSTDPEFNAMIEELFITYSVVSTPKKKKAKKSVSFLVDVPYKHSASGEVFEGPIWSQLTFEKEKGEDKEVFVNPERSV